MRILLASVRARSLSSIHIDFPVCAVELPTTYMAPEQVMACTNHRSDTKSFFRLYFWLKEKEVLPLTPAVM